MDMEYGSIVDCPRDSDIRSEIWMMMDIGRLIGKEKNKKILENNLFS